MDLLVLKKLYSVYKFSHIDDLPAWIYNSEFFSITKTPEEISVVTLQNESVFEEIICNNDWRVIKIKGPLDFSLTGIIARISGILFENNIPIFTISTFNTDYIMIKQKDLTSGLNALQREGYILESEKEDQVPFSGPGSR